MTDYSLYLPYIAAISLVIAISLILQFAFRYIDQKQIQSRRQQLLSMYATSRAPEGSQKTRQYSSSRSAFSGLGNKFVTGKYEKGLRGLLGNSGESEIDGYSILIYQKGLYTLGAIAIALILVISNGASAIMLAIALILLGFFLPDLLLKNKVLKRKQEIADLLPDAIDLLQMCVGAGLAFPAALAKVAETQAGPVAEEFARVTAEVQLGQSRVEALHAMAERTKEPHVSKFVSSMSQVDSFGIPISNVLKEQSKQMRMIRRERAREKGQKVPIKLLAPIMLCFLPCVMVIILGPAILSIIRAFSA